MDRNFYVPAFDLVQLTLWSRNKRDTFLAGGKNKEEWMSSYIFSRRPKCKREKAEPKGWRNEHSSAEVRKAKPLSESKGDNI